MIEHGNMLKGCDRLNLEQGVTGAPLHGLGCLLVVGSLYVVVGDVLKVEGCIFI